MNDRILFSTMAMVVLGASAAHAQHNTDIWVGNGGGSVAISPGGLQPSSIYNPLFRVDTFLHGWSNNNPGFDHTATAQGGVAPLVSPAQIWLEVVALEPALFVIDNAFNVLELPGDRTLLGGATLHAHLTWFIDETDPGFDPDQCVWEGILRLVDTGSGLGASQPFTLLFANVPVRGGEFPPTQTPADDDFDDDHHVDAFDVDAFVECMNGPDRRTTPDDPETTTCEVDCYNAFDSDDDLDIDLTDFAQMQILANP